ncbi:MAG TPA: hypothetical protein DIT64_13510 [Verrucomicrobiales bacterium]|nr:hypothetical protein [Verrucomicrobiales bacterium]HCN75797.1 hypothetical protein [Verrucomicrobiales bacterium]HRJ09830.1 hypothetical protein [Prosthecobacter sp.]HRK14731.1 hypothetical protein [Prosthecobacter sp.]
MKLKSMTSVITKSAMVLAACASLSAFAGPVAPSGKGTVAPLPEPDGALFDTLGAELAVGYDTRTYYRGLWFADNAVWTSLNLSIPLTEQVSLGLGALYLSTVETTMDAVNGPGVPNNGVEDFDYSELDLMASLSYDAGFATFGLVYTHYEFWDGYSGTNFGLPNGAGEGNVSGADEVGITFATSVGPVNLAGGYFYDFRIGGSYFELGGDLPIEITSWLSLVPAVKVGYGIDYYTSGVNPAAPPSGFTHVLPTLSAPIKLTKSATLTPYIAYNISLGARHALNTQDSEIFGGVKLGVTF